VDFSFCVPLMDAIPTLVTVAPGLRSLQLNQAKDILRDSELQLLTTLTNLESLCITYSPITPGTCIKLLTSLKSLVELNFSNSTKLTQKSMYYVSGLTNLTSLDISETTFQLKDFLVDCLPHLTFLKSLAMSGCSIGVEGLVPLQKLPFLENLNISNCTSVFLDPLSNLETLVTLNMGQLFTVTDLSSIYPLTNLRNLTLDSVFDLKMKNMDNEDKKKLFSDQQLVKLSDRLTCLEKLNVNSWWISKIGLWYLTKLGNLKLLSLEKCKALEGDEIGKYMYHFPNMDIQTDSDNAKSYVPDSE